MTKFKDITIGDTFRFPAVDFGWNAGLCRKVGPRTYLYLYRGVPLKARVGTVNCEVQASTDAFPEGAADGVSPTAAGIPPQIGC